MTTPIRSLLACSFALLSLPLTAQTTLYFNNGENYGTPTSTTDANPLTINITSGTAAHNAVISGDGSLTKTGAGTIALSGTNLYSGGTLITEGTLSVANAGNLGTGDITASGGGDLSATSLEITGPRTFTVTGAGSTLTTSFLWFNRDGSANLQTFNVTDGGAVTLSSTLSLADINAASTGNLNVTGAGSAVDAAQTIYIGYTGNSTATVADGGTLSTGVALSIATSGGSSGTFNLNTGGTLEVGGTGGIAIGSGTGLFNFNGGTIQVTTSDLTSAAAMTLGTSTTSTVNTNGLNATLSGILSGSGSLTKTGAGTLTLSGINTYTGATTIAGGTLALAQGHYTLADTTDVNITNGATLDLVNGDETVGDVNLVNGTITANGDRALFADAFNVQSGTLGVRLFGPAALTKTTAGTVTLTRDAQYNGATQINEGVFNVSGAAASIYTLAMTIGDAAAATVNVTDGAWIYGHNGLTLGNTAAGTGTLNITTPPAEEMVSYSVTSGGDIIIGHEGAGHVAISGGGSLASTADIGLATGTGGSATVTVSGTDGESSTSAIGATGALVIAQGDNSNATLTVSADGRAGFNGGVTIGAGTGSNGTLTITGTDSILSGVGLGTPVTIALATGTGSTAQLNILDGSEVILADSESADALTTGPGTAIVTINNGTLSTTAGGTLTSSVAITTAGSNTLNTDTGTIALSGALSGDGSLTKTGTGTLTLSGANSYTGGTTVSAGTLTGNTTSLQGDITNNAAVTFDQASAGTYGGIMSGTGTLTKSGSGALTLSGANTYTGDTTISAGTLAFATRAAFYGDTVDATTAGRLFTSTGATALFFVGDASYFTSADIDTIMGNSGFYTGATLALDTSHATGGAFTLSTNLLNTDSGENTVSFLKSGVGTLTLTGDNTYTGTTTVSAGTLSFTDPGTFYNGTIDATTAARLNVASGATAAFTVGGGSFSGADIGTILSSGAFAAGSTASLDTTSAGGSFTTTYTGAANLTKLGTGTLVLADTNSGTGTITVSGGTLQIGDGLTETSLAASAIASDSTVTFNPGGYGLTFAGVYSGTGGLTLSDMGALTLSGANTFTGDTTISSSATLNVGHSLALQNSTYVTGSGMLSFNTSTATLGGLAGSGSLFLPNTSLSIGGNNADTTYSGTISGLGTFIKTGTGNLTFSGAFFDSNAVSLEGGTFTLGSANTLQNNAVTLNGGTLAFGALTSATLGSLAGSGNLALTNTTPAAVALTVGANGNSSTYSGILSGSGSLTKTGMGMFTLSGANTFTGDTTLNDGTLRLEPTGSLTGALNLNGGFLELANATGLQSSTVTVNGGFVMFSAIDSATFGGLAGSGSLNLPSTSLTVGTNNADTNYSGNITGNGAFTKTGSGNLTFSGSFNESNAVSLNDGTFTLGASNALQYNSVTLNGGALGFGALTSVTLGSLAGSGNLALTNNADAAVALTVGNSSGDTTYAGILSGSGSLTKTGMSTFTLSGANTFTGDTTISDGTLRLDATGSLAGNLTLSNGTLELANPTGLQSSTVTLNGGFVMFSAIDSATFGGLAGSGSLNLPTTSLTVGGNNADTNYSGTIAGSGTFIKTGSGNLTFSGSFDESNAVNLNGGTFTLGAANTLENSAVTLNGGALAFGSLTSATFGTLAGSGTLALTNNTAAAVALTVGYSGNSSSYAGILSGGGSLTKTGSGTFTFSGANTFTGGTTVSQGTLKLEADGSLAGNLTLDNGFLELANPTGLQSSTVTVNSGSISYTGIDSATFGGLAGSGSLNIPFTSLTVGGNNADTSYSGTLSGPGTFIKTGSGNFTFSGSFTEQNPVNLNGGTFTLGDTNALNNSAITLNGGTLDLGTFSPTVGTVTFNGGTFTNGNLNNATAYEVQTGSLSAALGGSAQLTKIGAGTFTLSGVNTYTGGTTVSAGTLVGNTASLQGDITNHAALTFDQSADGTYAGNLSGAGSLAKTGAGNLTLSNGSAASGTITVSAGTLTIGTGSTATLSASGITNDGTLAFNHSDTLSYAGVISGSGTLTKTGSGTLTLNSAPTYTGATTISGGTLRFGEYSAIGSTSITIGAGASLFVDGDGGGLILASGQTLGGTGSVIGSGLPTIGSGAHLAPGNSPGTLTFTNGLTLEAGAILDFELGTTSDLIRVSGGTLTGPSDGTVTLNLADSGGFGTGIYTIFDYTSATLDDSFDITDFALGSTIAGYDYSLGLLNSTLQLTAVSAVPEPSTYAMIFGLGACLAVVFKRRRMLGFVVWRKRRR